MWTSIRVASHLLYFLMRRVALNSRKLDTERGGLLPETRTSKKQHLLKH